MHNLWKEIQMENPYITIRTHISHHTENVLLHSHVFYEILFCQSGNIQYLLDDQRFRLQTGDILLIPPGLRHQPLFLEPMKESYKRIILWLNADFWDACVNDSPKLDFAFQQCKKRNSYLLRFNKATWNGLFSKAETVLSELQEKQLGWEFCTRYMVILIMAHISRIYYYQDIPSPLAEKENLMDNIYHYIDANLSSKITLDMIAKHFLVSKSTISHMFQKQFHISFYQCVIQRRLIAAKKEILSATPLQDIGVKVGFADYSSFYRAFKKEYEVSPREFRNIYLKNRQ